MADNEENSNKRLSKTSEHGKILMTINNLFQKINETLPPQLIRGQVVDVASENFNDMQTNEDRAL